MHEHATGVEAPTADVASTAATEPEGTQGSFSSSGALPPASRGFGEQPPSASDRAYDDAPAGKEPGAHQAAMVTQAIEVKLGGHKVKLAEGTYVEVFHEAGGNSHCRVYSGHGGQVAFVPTDKLHLEPALSKVGNKFGDKYEEYEGALWHGQPKATDVNQGRAGDCWLVSSAAAIAGTNPEDIMRLFAPHTPNLNRYKVTLHRQVGDKLVPISLEVDTELATESTDGLRPTYDGLNTRTPGAGNSPMWPMLLEKAYAQMDGMGTSEGYKGIDKGAWPQSAMEVFTGKKATNQVGQQMAPNVFEEDSDLIAMLARGEAVCCGTQSLSDQNRRWFKEFDFVDDHAYYLKAIEGDSMIFENPWGNHEPKRLPKTYFYAIFGEISGVTIGHEKKPKDDKKHDRGGGGGGGGQIHGGGGG